MIEPGLRTALQPISAKSPTKAPNLRRPVSMQRPSISSQTVSPLSLRLETIAPAPKCDLWPRIESPT